jgi:PIN domain nuclease of toxin-antitoxin system
MDFILDTHALLWYAEGNKRLSKRARDMIDDASNKRLVSMASLWEIAIKHSIGKLTLTPSYQHVVEGVIAANRFHVLAIARTHLVRVARLDFPPNGHRDPFDRLLVAQSLAEDVPIVSRDGAFGAYDVEVVW